MVDKIVEATKLAQEMAPEFEIDGELQADTAIVPKLQKQKHPIAKLLKKQMYLFSQP